LKFDKKLLEVYSRRQLRRGEVICLPYIPFVNEEEKTPELLPQQIPKQKVNIHYGKRNKTNGGYIDGHHNR